MADEARKAALLAEAEARRARMLDSLSALKEQLHGGRVVTGAVEDAAEAVGDEMRRATRDAQDAALGVVREALDWAGEAAVDAKDWIGDHKGIAIGGALAAAALTAGAVKASHRKKVVPLYAAYDMEDDMGIGDTADDVKDRLEDKVDEVVDKALDRAEEVTKTARAKAVKAADAAKHKVDELAHKAEDVTRTAREKAANIAESAKDAAALAAAAAREHAHEARIAAEKAAEDARRAAQDATKWAKETSSEHPFATVATVFAVGAVLALVLPRLFGGRSH